MEEGASHNGARGEEIRAAFALIADGIARLGDALAVLLPHAAAGKPRRSTLVPVEEGAAGESPDASAPPAKKQKAKKAPLAILKDDDRQEGEIATAPTLHHADPSPVQSAPGATSSDEAAASEGDPLLSSAAGKRVKGAKKRAGVAKEGAPKRPMNAYLIFYCEQKALLAGATPPIAASEMSQHIGRLWATAERAPYEARYRESLRAFKAQMDAQAAAPHSLLAAAMDAPELPASDGVVKKARKKWTRKAIIPADGDKDTPAVTASEHNPVVEKTKKAKRPKSADQSVEEAHGGAKDGEEKVRKKKKKSLPAAS